MDAENVKASYVVVIEWNGKKPPTTFYNRLHEYGLWSRDRRSNQERDEVSLMTWRGNRPGSNKSDAKSGLVIQEGMIMVASYGLAQEIALLARKAGAVFVQVGQMYTSDLHASVPDMEAFEERQMNISKRGPKPIASNGTYCVTCYEEAQTYEVETDMAPMTCLHQSCRSTFIVSRFGRLPRFRKPQDGENLADYWARTRFDTGEFVIPIVNNPEEGSYPAPRQLAKQVTLPKMKLTKALKEAMLLDTALTFRAYDIAYCMSTRSPEARRLMRVHAVNSFASENAEGYYSFAVKEDTVDTLDLVSVDYETFSKYL